MKSLELENQKILALRLEALLKGRSLSDQQKEQLIEQVLRTIYSNKQDVQSDE